ncbi:unnamed protein product [Closterium sp. NIES-65]|nr:unnamed protein product [Closterium sp. NIES-65]
MRAPGVDNRGHPQRLLPSSAFSILSPSSPVPRLAEEREDEGQAEAAAPVAREVRRAEAVSFLPFPTEAITLERGLTLLKGKASTTMLVGTTSDLVPGKYEGGFKLWEAAVDLMEAVREDMRDGTLSFRRKHVLELGCGHGLPGILACLKGAAAVHFQDFNAEVLLNLTIPNLTANLAAAAAPLRERREHKAGSGGGGRGAAGEREGALSPCSPPVTPKSPLPDLRTRFFAGGTSALGHGGGRAGGGGGGYDIIMTAETVYSPRSMAKLLALVSKVRSMAKLLALVSKVRSMAKLLALVSKVCSMAKLLALVSKVRSMAKLLALVSKVCSMAKLLALVSKVRSMAKLLALVSKVRSMAKLLALVSKVRSMAKLLALVSKVCSMAKLLALVSKVRSMAKLLALVSKVRSMAKLLALVSKVRSMAKLLALVSKVCSMAKLLALVSKVRSMAKLLALVSKVRSMAKLLALVSKVRSMAKLLALVSKCLRRPHGVLYVAGKKHYFGVGGGTRQFKSLVDQQGSLHGHLLKEVVDGSSNVREVWKFFYRD